MQLVNMGQRGFMAMDAEARCAVGFLAEEFLEDGRDFEKLVLANLLALTAEALRWKPGPSPHSDFSRVFGGAGFYRLRKNDFQGREIRLRGTFVAP
jgi:hypothetical protein